MFEMMCLEQENIGKYFGQGNKYWNKIDKNDVRRGTLQCMSEYAILSNISTTTKRERERLKQQVK